MRFSLLLFFLIVLPARALAYPQFIGFGYSSCLSCHYNSSGNGPLNDYGRALFATEVADRIGGGGGDEKLVERSGFLFGTGLPDWWRPNLSYRGLSLHRSITRTKTSRFIHMKADMTNVIRFDQDEKYIAVVNFGYAPIPRNTGNIPQAQRNWLSREHYLRLRASDHFHFYFGLADKVYGIRVPDHEAFARKFTSNAQNDQVHGAIAHLSSASLEVSLQTFMGNLQQEQDARQKGAAFTAEYELAEMTRVGVSAQYLASSYVHQFSAAALTRLGLGHGSALLSELGVNRVSPTGFGARTGMYWFLQPHLRLSRGLSLFMTTEYYAPELTADRTRFMRIGPGLMYFPFQRLELRVEAWNDRSFDPESVRREDWSLLGQVSVWL